MHTLGQPSQLLRLGRRGPKLATLASTLLEFRVHFAVILILFCSASAQTVSHFRFTEKPGPYAVGLRVIEQYDYTRTFHSSLDVLGKPYTGERARPLQTLIWYPAAISTAKKMTVANYTQLLATETNFVHPLISSDWQTWIKAVSPHAAR